MMNKKEPEALIHQSLSRAIRWLLGGIFLYAGAVKLLEPASFAEVIAGYGLLPASLIFPFAVGLPLLEIISATGLVFRIRGSMTVIFLQLLVFISILTYGIWLGLDVDCGCFGPDDPEQAYKGLKGALLRDLMMLAGLVYLYWHDWLKKRGKGWDFPHNKHYTGGQRCV